MADSNFDKYDLTTPEGVSQYVFDRYTDPGNTHLVQAQTNQSLAVLLAELFRRIEEPKKNDG